MCVYLQCFCFSSPGIKPYKCQFCQKAFSRRAHMLEHQRSHTDNYRFRCPTCNKGFTRQKYYQDHKCPLAARTDEVGGPEKRVPRTRQAKQGCRVVGNGQEGLVAVEVAISGKVQKKVVPEEEVEDARIQDSQAVLSIEQEEKSVSEEGGCDGSTGSTEDLPKAMLTMPVFIETVD